MRFICPQCGACFERDIKRDDNIMRCRHCKPKVDKGKKKCKKKGKKR